MARAHCNDGLYGINMTIPERRTMEISLWIPAIIATGAYMFVIKELLDFFRPNWMVEFGLKDEPVEYISLECNHDPKLVAVEDCYGCW